VKKATFFRGKLFYDWLLEAQRFLYLKQNYRRENIYIKKKEVFCVSSRLSILL